MKKDSKYHNAFYPRTKFCRIAVNEEISKNLIWFEPKAAMKTSLNLSAGGGVGKVCVSIIVCDKGNYIPQKVLNKIFQLFFIIKPSGQHTELGSNSGYDIIRVQAREINVEPREQDWA